MIDMTRGEGRDIDPEAVLDGEDLLADDLLGDLGDDDLAADIEETEEDM